MVAVSSAVQPHTASLLCLPSLLGVVGMLLGWASLQNLPCASVPGLGSLCLARVGAQSHHSANSCNTYHHCVS